MSPDARPRVLVVDDEPSIVDIVSSTLSAAGFDVEIASDGHSALEIVRKGALDAALVDVMLPDTTGFEILRRWTAEGYSVPTIFLTARGDESDVTQGFSLGADDYIRKPFGLEELVARVRAVLRRSGHDRPTSKSNLLRFADIRMDRTTFSVHRSGQPVELSPTEFRLLEKLLENSGRVLTRSQLIDAVWDSADSADHAALETAISRLRRKLNQPGTPELLMTRRGIGYGLLAPCR